MLTGLKEYSKKTNYNIVIVQLPSVQSHLTESRIYFRKIVDINNTSYEETRNWLCHQIHEPNAFSIDIYIIWHAHGTRHEMHPWHDHSQ